MSDGPASTEPVSLGRIVFGGHCPACGQGSLFKSWLEIADECNHCKLPLKQHEQGDGPAFFGVLIVGAAAAIGAAVVEIKYEPPFWLHAVIWLPFIVISSLLLLRWLKAALVGVQYQLRRQDFGPESKNEE